MGAAKDQRRKRPPFLTPAAKAPKGKRPPFLAPGGEGPQTKTAALPGPGGRRPPNENGRPSWAAGSKSFSVSSRSEEHTSELQSLMRSSYAVFCLKKNK